jgi:hypothetical protein
VHCDRRTLHAAIQQKAVCELEKPEHPSLHESGNTRREFTKWKFGCRGRSPGQGSATALDRAGADRADRRLRILNTNFGGTKFGVFTERPETLSHEKFVKDFVATWNKVMNLDRYDLLPSVV